MSQGVAVGCSGLQCDARCVSVRCGLLVNTLHNVQCVVLFEIMTKVQLYGTHLRCRECVAVCCSVLQCVAVSCVVRNHDEITALGTHIRCRECVAV